MKLTIREGRNRGGPWASSSLSSSSSSSSLVADQAPEVDNSNTVGDVDSSDGAEGNADRSKKLVWNKPSNGVVVETGPVMGAAESWPTLLASTKGSAKLPPESSSNTVIDYGSLSTSPQGPMASQSPQKQATTNAKPNSAPNYNVPGRQRSMKRVGGSSSTVSDPSQGNFSNPPPPPPPLYTSSHQLAIVIWGYFGPHPRGDGSYHNSYGSRRDHQDRGNYVNTRDAFVPQPRMPPRGLPRHTPPPTTAAAFVGPQPIGPFAKPIGFPEFYYYQPVTVEQFTGMSFFAHSPPPTPFFSAAESPLSNMIVYQIEYYFSDANLVKDAFLRSKMDEQGWVPVTLIADFPRVKSLTTNIQLILDSIRTSAIVEVQGDKLRRLNEWKRWLSSTQRGSTSPIGSRYNNLTTNLQTIKLEETIKDEDPRMSNGGDATGSSSGNN
ncbi:La-related protein 1B [Glycine soja]|nr:La-related protein 1B [Glycine soja]